MIYFVRCGRARDVEIKNGAIFGRQKISGTNFALSFAQAVLGLSLPNLSSQLYYASHYPVCDIIDKNKI